MSARVPGDPRWRGLLYRLYARRLEAEVRRRPTPRHVGIILDGNRRWARAQGRDFVDAYALFNSGLSLFEMIEAYKLKYGFDNERSILTALIAYDNVEKHEMPDMIFPAKWKDVVKKIEKTINEYLRDPRRAR